MKINYDLKFKEELEKIKGTKPSLLLHVCCGPCSGNVLKEISELFITLIQTFIQIPSIFVDFMN